MKLRESQMKAKFLSLMLSLQTSWQFFSFCHNANSITNYWTQKVGSGKIHSQIEGCSKYLNCAVWLVQTCVIRCVKRIRIDNFLIRCVLCTLLKRASPLHFTRLVWTCLDPTWQYCLQYYHLLLSTIIVGTKFCFVCAKIVHWLALQLEWQCFVYLCSKFKGKI